MADVGLRERQLLNSPNTPHLLEKTKFNSMNQNSLIILFKMTLKAKETLNEILTNRNGGNRNFINIDYQKLQDSSD